jgi:hypothetical protein
MKRLLNYISTLIIILGILVFIINMLIGIYIIKINFELPICKIQKIQETNNKIYIGLASYSRIQVYNLNGKYLKFLPVKIIVKILIFMWT